MAAAPVVVEVAPAELRTLSEIIEAVGTTRARQSVDIVPEASGRIEALHFSAGQKVEAGTILLQLDDRIESANLAEAEAKLIERERVLARITRLRGSSAVSEATMEDAIARLAEARAQLDRAKQRLAERTIRAPFAGTIGLAEVDRGARVSTGTFLARLDDLSEVEVEFSLPETLFARVNTGQTITSNSVAFPGRSFTGQIEAVDSRIDPVSRSFRTRAVIPNPNGTLPAGMFMSLELVLSQADHIVVPEEAIVYQAAEAYVFAVADGHAAKLRVKTGQRRDGFVAILDGVQLGDRVVIRGLQRVRDGAAVRILGSATDTADKTGNGS
ncbi:efflux RND transporter periplasmic adaptor subunit [Thalassovita sp.]|uniref:efflux RND transporter periplasmic adaptor subunit n=1 Tax=Thalassovita sp. TaxID=1979401 RepID=UPI0029DE8FBB|nr:efflux RND transporter periplasmic adaptor subunit [Thalassovita sp.]